MAQAAADGRLTANGEERTDGDRVMRGGDWVVHRIHRHEPPVLWTGGSAVEGLEPAAIAFPPDGDAGVSAAEDGDGDPAASALGMSVVKADAPYAVEIVAETDSVVVVNKPASVPVHPCGQYRKNTVVAILEAERGDGFRALSPVHRLDRLVSGILIFSKNPKQSDELRQAIVAGRVRKTYLARVEGIFPEGDIHVDAAIAHDAARQTSSITGGWARNGGAEGALLAQKEGPRGTGAVTEVDKAARKAAQRGQNAAVAQSPAAKDAYTVFRRVSTDGRHSVVECRPRTGRTHQLRVHLQFVGHPIVGDPLYAADGATANGAALYARGAAAEAVTAAGKGTGGEEGMSSAPPPPKRARVADVPAARALRLPAELRVVTCPHCPQVPPHDFDIDVVPLLLHALRYECDDGWSFETSKPPWAELQ